MKTTLKGVMAASESAPKIRSHEDEIKDLSMRWLYGICGDSVMMFQSSGMPVKLPQLHAPCNKQAHKADLINYSDCQGNKKWAF